MLKIEDLKEPVLTETAKTILEKRYLAKDEAGKIIETPKQLFYRVAKAMASVEQASDDYTKIFYNMMVNFDFLPNTPTLINAGRKLGMLSACFVLPISDSMDGIFKTLRDSALIFKSGGGVGYAFSDLRPRGDVVSSTVGVSSGPISFMRVYNAATEEIKQGGVRRGAMMAVLRVDHPDIIDFIKCKDDTKQLTNFNISVAVTDEFMKAVEKDKTYWVLNPRTKAKMKELKAREVFDVLVKQAWKNGEPGVVFIDEINKHNALIKMGEIKSTNPCGEQPLFPYESCNLGSINLANFIIEEPAISSKPPSIDFNRLRYTIYKAVRFLDNVIDVNAFPLPEIEAITKGNRKIGLGIMGWADTLIKLRVPYNSKKALELAEEFMSTIQNEAINASKELAKEKGTFPNIGMSNLKEIEYRRNTALTTIAPTGTISMIAGCSSGIEPLFGVAYVKKNILDNKSFYEVNDHFKKELVDRGIYSDKLLDEVVKKGSVQDIKEIPDGMKKVYVISHDIVAEDHIKMQAAFQKHVCSSISKTINFPRTASSEEVKRGYLLAYELGCKGVTVYRDGSRELQVLNIGEEKKEEIKDKTVVTRKRPNITEGKTYEVLIGCGNLYVTINEDDKGICETFITVGKSGGCISSWGETVGRLVSLSLRSNIQVEKIIKQLKGIRCSSPRIREGGVTLSCADGIATVLLDYLKTKKKEVILEKKHKVDIGFNPECPECGDSLIFTEGCIKCPNCGYSRCS